MRGASGGGQTGGLLGIRCFSSLLYSLFSVIDTALALPNISAPRLLLGKGPAMLRLADEARCFRPHLMPPAGLEEVSIQRFGLVNQHDGNVVLDLIEELAVLTDESVACLVQVDFPLTLWTGEYVKQLLADSHHPLLCAVDPTPLA
jgi:hypothetical protein